MTIEYLPTRLPAGLSTCKASKLRMEQLSEKVLDLETRLLAEVERRKSAESALQESLLRFKQSVAPADSGIQLAALSPASSVEECRNNETTVRQAMVEVVQSKSLHLTEEVLPESNPVGKDETAVVEGLIIEGFSIFGEKDSSSVTQDTADINGVHEGRLWSDYPVMQQSDQNSRQGSNNDGTAPDRLTLLPQNLGSGSSLEKVLTPSKRRQDLRDDFEEEAVSLWAKRGKDMTVSTEVQSKVEQYPITNMIFDNGLGYVDCGKRDEHAVAPAVVAVQDHSSSSVLQMMAAVEVLLQGIGEDIKREGLLKTPLRVASAFQGAIAGYQLSAKEIVGAALFSEDGTIGEAGCGGGSGGIVIVRNIDTFALCESCLLPFRIRCHVVYIPSGERVVGLSKLPRVAEIFAKRLQNPQKFADDVVAALNESFGPLGVGLVVESWHLQWPGVCEGNISVKRNPEDRLSLAWVPMIVYAGKGKFENLGSSLWDEVLTILQLEGPTLGAEEDRLGRRQLCPFIAYDGQEVSSTRDSTMPLVSTCITTMAVGIESLLHAVGETPSKERLLSSAMRFVNWIISATRGSRACGVVNGGQISSTDNCCVMRYGNSLVNDSNCTLSNGSSMLKLEGKCGVQRYTKDVVCSEWDISFSSLCEHHLLPFCGALHLGYVLAEGSCDIDRSVLVKIVRMYSRRLQVQERFTRQIAEAVFSLVGLQGIMVVAEASHMCIMSRGVEKVGSSTITVTTIGRFSSDGAMRAGFLKRISKQMGN